MSRTQPGLAQLVTSLLVIELRSYFLPWQPSAPQSDHSVHWADENYSVTKLGTQQTHWADTRLSLCAIRPILDPLDGSK